MTLDPLKFYHALNDIGISFFTGVPDSLLKEFCFCLESNVKGKKHIIAANEGNAISIAAGYHLGTGKVPMVYMQNSGLGNAVNPLLSLCDPDVYSIPMIILLGWRGEPGLSDEPQHLKQGKVQENLIKSMGIPFSILTKKNELYKDQLLEGFLKAKRLSMPFIFFVQKNTFSKYGTHLIKKEKFEMKREEALQVILDQISDDIIIISNTGKTSREIFEIREKNNQPHFKDFLTVGSMGHCSSIALGIAISNPTKKVLCIDGDGSLIMHMGNLSTIGKISPNNFYHVLLNNQVHESVGGQETAADSIDFLDLAKANSYKNMFISKNKTDLTSLIKNFIESQGPSFFEVKIRPGSREELGRPTIEPIDNKKSFMQFIKK